MLPAAIPGRCGGCVGLCNLGLSRLEWVIQCISTAREGPCSWLGSEWLKVQALPSNQLRQIQLMGDQSSMKAACLSQKCTAGLKGFVRLLQEWNNGFAMHSQVTPRPPRLKGLKTQRRDCISILRSTADSKHWAHQRSSGRKKKQWSILDPALQECSSGQRKQLLRSKCFGQDGTRKREARPLSSSSSCLLRFVPNKLWKHNPNTVYMLFSKSVLNPYCVPWLLWVIHWESKDQWELCVLIVYFYKAQHENCSKWGL